jgi:cytoplasmic iron level regulating protein YaaA (DUF328/UPF0246 family)
VSGRFPVILLPPSEGKAPGGRGAPWAPGRSALPELDSARARVLDALAASGVDGGVDLGKARTLPAIRRYTGVLYQALDWESLSPEARRLGNRSVLIASGLWGLSAPGDPLPAYRLKMSASLAPLGKLSTWWRPHLTAALAEHLAGRLVWDLLPAEHAAAWRPEGAPPRRRVTVRFVDAGGKTVSHWNKLLKGALVRHLLTERPAGPEALAGWEHPSGYRVDEASSVFGRREATLVLRERARGTSAATP